MWNPFAALMRAEDRMFAARSRRKRPSRPVLSMIIVSAVLLTVGLVVLFVRGFDSARAPLLLAVGFAVWTLYLAIVRLTVRDRPRR